MDHEERIAAGLLINQQRQRTSGVGSAAQGVGDEPLELIETERRQDDLLRPRSGVAHRGQCPHERMRRTNFVATVGSDQQQVPHVRISSQAFQQFQRRGVKPLQIVEEQRQGMLRSREHVEEPTEYQLETIARRLRRQIRNGRLFSDEELKLGNEVDHQLAVRSQCIHKGAPPTVHLSFTLNEDLADQHLKCLRQCCVGYVALVLVKLTGGEQPARRNQRLVQFAHHR